MSTVDPSQVSALVADAGYDVMLEGYSRDPLVYPQICETFKTDGTEPGWTAKSIAGTTEPEETERGQDAPGRTIDEVYQWFIKSRKLQESLIIPEEMWRSGDARALIEQHVRENMGGMGAGFSSKKEKMVAGLFNRGSITAGDRNFFKGAYTGHPNTNEGFIYDGKPFFAASGNGHPLGIATSTTLFNQDANALNATNLDSAYVLHTATNAYNEAAEFVGGNRPDVLVVPPQLEGAADRLLSSELVAGSANNDINNLRNRFKRITWWALTDTDGWFLGRRNEGVRVYDSGIPRIEVSDPDRNNGNITVRLVGYLGCGVTQWRRWSAHATSTA